MTDNMKPDTRPRPQTEAARTPIRVDKLLLVTSNPHGMRLPLTSGDKIEHTISASTQGDIKTEISYMPWLRHHCVTRHQRFGAGKEEQWKPYGKPFYVHETFAVWVPAEE